MLKAWDGMRNASAFIGLCGAALLIAVAAGCGGSSNHHAAPVAQGLWLPNYGGNTITEFTGSNLTASGTPSANLTNSSADLSEPWTIAFDKNGNLWSTNYNNGSNGTITEYTASQLKNLGSNPAPTPNVVISGLAGPSGLTFDSAGDLWVADWLHHKLVEFTPSQLATTGSPTPTITITSASFSSLSAVEFDKSGNLWVADNSSTADSTGSTGEVFEFTPSQLSAGGSQSPSIALATSTIDRPYPIAFDKSGNLWLANFDTDTVQEFAASDLTGSGVITPAATVTLSETNVTTSTGTAQSLDGPNGLAFDNSGDLWVSNWYSDNHGSLAEFTPSQIAASGSPSPKVFLDSDASGSNMNNPVLIAFGPSIP